MFPYEELKKELIPISAPVVKKENYNLAAVLVPIFINSNEILLTKRASTLRQHKGQIAFPGGKYDKNDKSLLETCLRETEEEVGIKREQIEVIGRLNPLRTTTKNCVYPFVGLIKNNVDVQINEMEVEDYFYVKIKDLMEPKNQRIGFFKGGIRLYYLIENYRIWGVTRKILSELVKKIKKLEKSF